MDEARAGISKLSLHKETIRSLQDSDLKSVVGGATEPVTTVAAALCVADPFPPWVSTSPPTHMCY